MGNVMYGRGAQHPVEDLRRTCRMVTRGKLMTPADSVFRYCPSSPSKGSVASRAAQSDNEKLGMEPTKLSNADQFSRDSKCRGGGTGSSRNNISRETLENRQQDTRHLIPVNIRHKYGSSVVDQLISSEQVRSCLREAEERAQYTHGYRIPRPSMKSWLMEDYAHKTYYELGHCLRSNIFPGVPIKQRSLVQDSYTADVNEKGKLDKHNRQHWYGRKTDDLAIWSQMLMERIAIAKILQSQLKPSRTFPRPIRTNVFRDVPPPLTPPPKKHKKCKQRTEKPEAPPPPITKPKQEDGFWDFYDKPIQ